MSTSPRAASFSLPSAGSVLAGGAGVLVLALLAGVAYRNLWQLEPVPARHFALAAADWTDRWWLLQPGDPRRPSNPYPTRACGDDQPPRQLAPGITRPELLESVMPRRFGLALRSQLRGVVVLEMVIGTDGRPCDVRILRGLPMGLDREAVAAVHRWRYRPARIGERAVPVAYRVEIRFELGA